MEYQRIGFETAISGHTLEMAKLFTIFSNIETVNQLAAEYPLDYAVKSMVGLVQQGAQRRFDIRYETIEHECTFNTLSTVNAKNVIVCFSGGKDSTAAALKMRNIGYNVYLYFVHGINKSYADEKERAEEIAKHLGLPLFVEKITLKGKTTFHDNPVKNQLIASMAVDYGLRAGIGARICFGDFYTDNVENSSFLEAWSDTIEMWMAHKEYVRMTVPQYDIIIPFKNYIETMDVMASNADLMKMVQGCVLPQRFREFARQKNSEKYGIELLPRRCGSCWKCCVEYIHYADIGVVEYNKDFYRHCLEFLDSKMPVLRPNIPERDFKAAYESFLYQPYEQSKYYNDDSK